MKSLPANVNTYKKTKTFDEKTVPAALLKNHQTLAGVWGKIVIVRGKLEYVIKTEVEETLILDIEKFGVVEPQMIHHLNLLGPVEFYVEFFK